MKPPEDLRRTLIDASVDLLATEGLEAFSMREVARRAGVSHQAPYHHFHDREAILAEIVTEGFRGLRAEMETAIEGVNDPADRLTAIGKAYVAFAVSHPAHFKVMFRSELVQAAKHDEARACADSAFDLVVSIVDDVVRDGRGRTDPSLVLAAWSLAHGLATLMLEGKLERHCGKSKRAQTAAAHAVLESFTALIRVKALTGV